MVMYELAFHLKMTVRQLKDEMYYDELLKWISYLDQRPVDWRADDRTFKLLQAQGYKGKPEAAFQSLARIYRPVISADGKMSANMIQGSAFFQKMLSAKGGDDVAKTTLSSNSQRKEDNS